MYIEYLECFYFRNIKHVRLNMKQEMIVVHGKNAQGKTNLLEALYFCATGKSFRQSSSQDMIHHDHEECKIKARFIRHKTRHEIEIFLKPQKRKIYIDGKILKNTTKLLDIVNVISFFPDDLYIIKGSPEKRRHFLDRSIANHKPEFIRASIAYYKTLKSRNALLKEQNTLYNLLDVYDEQLILHGAIIHKYRLNIIHALKPLVEKYFGQIMNWEGNIDLELESGLGSDYEENMDYEQSYRKALKKNLVQDQRRKITSLGPHRSDINIKIDGFSARQFASQGQQRALVLSLKLAELIYLSTYLDVPPILLLDDVASELDKKRISLLFKIIQEFNSQIWISTSQKDLLPISESTTFMQMENGKLNIL